MPTKENIEFITVAIETCSFLEQSLRQDKKGFISKLLKILPLVYLKTSLLEAPEKYYEEDPERSVTEYDYENIRSSIASVLGTSDDFLDTYHPDIQLSDTPVLMTVSESLSDVYQELKDYVICCQYGSEEIMNDALFVCLTAFSEHWGQKLLSALQALHSVYYSGNLNESDDK